jgi:mannose-6-phosphate isomerase-like protein (cupin superfamily)
MATGTEDREILRAKTPDEPLQDYVVEDPYLEWVRSEGPRYIVDFAFEDLNTLELSPWESKGGSGAVINIPNNVIPNDAQVVEIKPGGKSEPVHHMYETQVYVLSGRGATSIWVDETKKWTFEWQPGSLFAIPLNAWYQFFNGSGTQPARYVAVTSAPPIMRLYRDNDFIFNNDHVFAKRLSDNEDAYTGSGKLYNRRVWESNFIPNADNMPLYGWAARGAGGINAALEMAKNSINAHISEFPVGTYKKGHRHGPGAHLILLSGDAGFSLLWTKEDRSDMRKADWKKGSMVVVPSDGTFLIKF